jgi:protein arginine kinase
VNIGDFVNRPTNSWLAPGDENGLVISSRIRLARNLRGAAFPSWAGEEECTRIWGELEPVLAGLDPLQPGFSADMPGLTDLDKQILFERHLMSREMAEKGAGSGLVGSLDERLAIMVNEEDHMRIQSLRAGMALREAWDAITALDTEIEKHVRYAFSPKLGYLTACPSNVGTGMRASVMLHLPGLVLMNEMNPIIKGMGKIGLAVRGLWGEGTEATGNMFQISNQVTLGEREEDIIANLEQIVLEVVEHEKNARIRLMEERDLLVRDHVGRAHGILMNAYILSSKEALDLLSGLRLGIDVEVLEGIDGRIVDELLLLTQPGHLQKIEGKKLKPKDRDEARAHIIRTRLAEAVKPKRRNKKSQSTHE